MSAITLSVNGEPVRIRPMSLAELVATLTPDPRSLATIVNGEFVAREARDDTVLADGDLVLTFRPIVGG